MSIICLFFFRDKGSSFRLSIAFSESISLIVEIKEFFFDFHINDFQIFNPWLIFILLIFCRCCFVVSERFNIGFFCRVHFGIFVLVDIMNYSHFFIISFFHIPFFLSFFSFF